MHLLCSLAASAYLLQSAFVALLIAVSLRSFFVAESQLDLSSDSIPDSIPHPDHWQPSNAWKSDLRAAYKTISFLGANLDFQNHFLQ